VASRARKRRTRPNSDNCALPEREEFKAPGEVASYIGRLAVEDVQKIFVGLSGTCANDVLLILASELTACDEEEGPAGLGRLRAWPRTKAREPEVKILFQLDSLRFVEAVVSDESNVN
jgi:hypothetical protein